MEISINEYKKDYSPLVDELIEDDFVKSDIIKCLEEFEKCGLVVMEKDKLIAVGVFTDKEIQTSVTLYVKPSKRNLGIGSKLLDALENKMRAVGVEEAVCDYKINRIEKKFMNNRGYKCWFKSNYMMYSEEAITLDNYKFIQYEDKYYYEVQRIMSSSFHRMRVSVGLESEEKEPSEDQRQWYKDNSENIYLLSDNGKVVAVSILENNEIDAVAVEIKEQGKGYGKAMISFSINKLIESNYKCINIWVVDGNPAKVLYEKLGFVIERIHEFDRKNIKI